MCIRDSRTFSPQKPYYTNTSDVPRSLQSWVSTIHTVVLTADVFQLLYHAACKVEFQPFTRSYSQLTFFVRACSMFYPYEGYRSVTPLDAARVNRTISITINSCIKLRTTRQLPIFNLFTVIEKSSLFHVPLTGSTINSAPIVLLFVVVLRTWYIILGAIRTYLQYYTIHDAWLVVFALWNRGWQGELSSIVLNTTNRRIPGSY